MAVILAIWRCVKLRIIIWVSKHVPNNFAWIPKANLILILHPCGRIVRRDDTRVVTLERLPRRTTSLRSINRCEDMGLVSEWRFVTMR